MYGDVIITKKPLDITDPEMKVKRNDRSEVVDLIIDDLNHAVENLPAFKELTTEEEGRISKEGAQAFLSRVALYEGTWQKSRNGNQNTQRSANLLDIAAKAARTVIDAKYGYTFRLFGTDSETKYWVIVRRSICSFWKMRSQIRQVLKSLLIMSIFCSSS